jgi:type VI secretion system protein VasI
MSYRQEISKIVKIKDPTIRLKAYDNLSRLLGYEVQELPDAPKWSTLLTLNSRDHSKFIYISLKSDSGINAWDIPISLILKVNKKKIDIYADWGQYLGSESHVTSQFNSEKLNKESWRLSTDSKTTYYPGNKRKFIKKLLSNEKLMLRINPYNGPPIIAYFDIRGLENVLAEFDSDLAWLL